MSSGSISSMSGQSRSFSDMIETGSGHSSPRRGSSKRSPPWCSACRTRRPDSSSRCRRREPGSRVRTARGRESTARLGIERDRHVLQVCRALGSEIDDDVPDRSMCAAHELRLGRRGELEVHSAQRALLRVERRVRLCDHGLETVFFELVLAEGPSEEATLVLPTFELDDERPGQLCLRKDHSVPQPLSDSRALPQVDRESTVQHTLVSDRLARLDRRLTNLEHAKPPWHPNPVPTSTA